MSVTLESKLKPKEELLASQLDGETVLLSMESENYYGMNQVSSRIWELCGEGLTLAEICRTLSEEFDVEPDQCEQEVLDFAQKLTNAGLAQTD